MADKVPIVHVKGKNLDDYIVDPKKDPISSEYEDGRPVEELEAHPEEFKEPEGPPLTPEELLTLEAAVKTKLKTEMITEKMKVEEAVRKRAEEDRVSAIAADSIKKRAEKKAAENKPEADIKNIESEVIIPEVVLESVETKEAEAERYKMILIDLGFHKKEGSENGKEQYILKDGELGIGRTFQKAFPTGKFWALRDGKFLELPEIKQLDAVMAFYAVRDGKKTIEDVAPKPAPENIRPATEEVEKYNPSTQIKRQIGPVSLVKKGGYYNVSGHKEPDAWLVQQWAIELGVSLKILLADQDDRSAKAIVRAEKDGLSVDAVVMHYFSTSRDVIALEIIEAMQRRRQNPIEGYREDGRPILSQETNHKIYKRVIRFMNFSLRDAVTKASRIATLKILNHDWREPEEIEAETAEVRVVNALKE